MGSAASSRTLACRLVAGVFVAFVLAAFSACGTAAAPPGLDLSLERPTRAGTYVVALQPPAVAPPLQQIHSWRLTLRTADGRPVNGATIRVDGGMPQHGHGLPTRPQATRDLGEGTYRIDGMKFSMTGWWEVRLAIEAAEGSDGVTFNRVVVDAQTADPAASRKAWTEEQRRLIASLSLDALGPPPADRSNAYEARDDAAALGRAIFQDARLSRDGSVSCASCHAADLQFQDGKPVATGLGVGRRRTMTVVGAAHSPWLFWDGRKDSLWSQALGPLEDAAEHGGNRTRLVRAVQQHHRAAYERVFGPMPALDGVPPDASPLGTPAERSAWQAMPPAQRADVDRVFARMGKAIAAFERTLVWGESRFDRFARALDPNASRAEHGAGAFTAQEENGLRVFIGAGQCVTCHNGPLFTDRHFHNTGVPQRDAERPDRGRAAAVAAVQADPFNCLGPHSDAPSDACGDLRFIVDDDPAVEGAFRTPGLRNVALRPPYMHAGQFATLEAVVNHYARSPAATVGRSELAPAGAGRRAERQPIRLSPDEARDLVAFLSTLSGPVVERPAR